MKYLVLLILYLAFTNALVHYKQLEKGKNGCKLNGTEIKVGDVAQDPETCGVYHCLNKKGDSLILYCQRPPYFVHCLMYAVDTTIDFPECCFVCARYVYCKNGKPLDEAWQWKRIEYG